MLEDTIVITFCGPEHREYQKEFHKLYHRNFDRHIDFSTEDLKQTSFYRDNMKMFGYKKYFGYFLWKPYIITKTLQLFPQKKVLYCDTNLRFKNFSQFENSYRQLMDVQGAFFVRHDNFINRHWTKWDCFYLMGATEDKYYNAHQVWTPLMGFSQQTSVKNLLDEYLYLCKSPEIVTEQPNKYGNNLDGFKEHRWEQSVMSILVEKYGYVGISDTQVMRWVTKEYSDELNKFKEEINEDPLAKSI